MSQFCEIRFANQIAEKTFWCGERVECTIVLNLSEPKTVKAVYVKISGWADSSWRDLNGEDSYYRGHEVYIDWKQYLFNGETELRAGVHTYNITYDIPKNLPSSVEGENGHIRYELQATLNLPFPNFNDNFKQILTLVKPSNLNTYMPPLAASFHKYLNQTFGCFSNPFAVGVALPQIGYVPGQIIKVDIKANNDSNVTIYSIKSSLCQIIKCFNNSAKRSVVQYKILTDSLVSGIPKNVARNVEVAIKVPTVAPTDIWASRIVHVTYCVKIIFNTNWMHKSPSIEIPITIGTIPLEETSSADLVTMAKDTIKEAL